MTRGLSDPPPARPAPPVGDRDPRSITGPLLLWLGVQLLALLVAVLRVPLAAQYPQPAELLAAPVMVVAQVVAVALLFPYLLRDVRSAVAVAATALPFLVLGGSLSAIPAARLVLAGSYVLTWIIVLAVWNVSAPPMGRSSGVAAATLLAAGTLVVFYLRLEYAAPAVNDARELLAAWAAASPPLAALHLLNAAPRALDWATPVGVFTTALVYRVATYRRRQVIHKF